MKTSFVLLVFLCLCVSPVQSQSKSDAFVVSDVFPGNKTQEVELEPLIQIHVSHKFDPATVNDKAVQLLRRTGQKVKVNIGGDLGGVITLSVASPLERNTEYQLKVTRSLKSRSGKAMTPMITRSRTTDKASQPVRPDFADFRFLKHRFDRREHDSTRRFGTQPSTC